MTLDEKSLALFAMAQEKKRESERLLFCALSACLDKHDFPEEIRQGFGISFASGGETVVDYCRDKEYLDVDLGRLLEMSTEEIITTFNC